MRPILEHLPEQLQGLTIEQGKRVLFQHFPIGQYMYVVLLTNMPGDCDRFWLVTKQYYWAIESLHESRDRWIRYRVAPTWQGEPNAPKPCKPPQPTLFAL